MITRILSKTNINSLTFNSQDFCSWENIRIPDLIKTFKHGLLVVDELTVFI